ncbi:hypothetical protein [Hansschlegelia zhihuaiae]|uniref:Uncharacterized protein n=1 Tax=Hansschlegelia zhihuaiae TaxID=405005 RepID=A0A4Q0MFM2_9HYPH|nr:hypothetical protein [Hansschlegelia zhihuaiae]RXF72094.1 hypothetical protein EK403_14895 [Hansschlegelia zhihuaiae]
MSGFPERGPRLPKALADLLGREHATGKGFEGFSAVVARLADEDVLAALTPHQASHIRMMRLVLVAFVEGGNAEVSDHGRTPLEALVAVCDAVATGLASLISELSADGDGRINAKAMRELRKIAEGRISETLRLNLREFQRSCDATEVLQ